MADVCQGLCIEWYRIFNVSLLKNESILRSSDLPVSCGAQRFHWEREEMCYSGRHTSTKHKKGHTQKSVSSVLALPIFPGRRQPSIVSRNELNYRVRNGNGWTLALISTNYLSSGLTGEHPVLYCLFRALSSAFIPLFKPAKRLKSEEEKQRRE